MKHFALITNLLTTVLLLGIALSPVYLRYIETALLFWPNALMVALMVLCILWFIYAMLCALGYDLIAPKQEAQNTQNKTTELSDRSYYIITGFSLPLASLVLLWFGTAWVLIVLSIFAFLRAFIVFVAFFYHNKRNSNKQIESVFLLLIVALSVFVQFFI